MELSASDTETITIRFRSRDYDDLLSVLAAFRLELDGGNIDLALLPNRFQSNKQDTQEFLDAFFDLAEKSALPQPV